MKILSFGEILFDDYGDKRFIGGAGLNFAAHCLNCGAESYMISAVGNDLYGDEAVDIINKLSVSSQFIRRTEKETGRCIVRTDSKEIPVYEVLEDTAYDNIEISDNDILKIKSLRADALYFGTLIQRNNVSAKSLKKICSECTFKEIACDINLRKNCYNYDSVKFCFENATILKLSDEEEPLLHSFNLYCNISSDPEEICKSIGKSFPQIKYIIFTMGANGSFIYNIKKQTGFFEKAKQVISASAVGAGDSYFATWLTSYLRDIPINLCAQYASDVSGYVVSEIAAIPNYTFEEGILKKSNDIRPNNNTEMLCDMHTHSQNSHDGTCSVEEIAKSAVEKGISAFAVTDHCDIQYYVERDMPSCIDRSFNEALETEKKFKGKVKILKGIEIGEGIWNEGYTKEILDAHNYDVVIGSVHAVRYKNYTKPYAQIDFSLMKEEEIYEFLSVYFDEVMQMLREVPCDIMAHLTCPFSYINGKFGRGIDTKCYEEQIETILKYIIKHNIAMEINTKYNNYQPDKWIIEKYFGMGGYLITLGSDAHSADKVGNMFVDVIDFLKKTGFKYYCYYENRINFKCSL